jgi:hypothetical protein
MGPLWWPLQAPGAMTSSALGLWGSPGPYNKTPGYTLSLRPLLSFLDSTAVNYNFLSFHNFISKQFIMSRNYAFSSVPLLDLSELEGRRLTNAAKQHDNQLRNFLEKVNRKMVTRKRF